MNIETPRIPPHRKRHIELCQQVLDGHEDLSKVVDELRQSVAGKDRKTQSVETSKIAARERGLFKEGAAAAIDRSLPASADGTPASALEINEGLLNFVSLVTPNIRLRARAGSGKSTALVIKCDHLINALNVPPEAIQLLTFNRSAAEDLSRKLCEVLGDDVGSRVGVNTFHSLAYHVIQRAPNTRLTLSFKDEDRSETEHLSDLEKSMIKVTQPRDLRAYRERYEKSQFANMARKDNFDAFLRENITKATSLFRARQGGSIPVNPSQISRHIERIAGDYEDRLRQTYSLDGEAGLRRAASILSSGVELAGFKRLTGGLQFLFVDEFQDFSPAFAKLTQGVMLRNPSCILNAVGDDWQSINAFMGADLSYFNGLKKSYPASLNLPLQSNWRCGKHIVDLGNKVMGADDEIAAVAAQPHDGRIRVQVGGIEKKGWPDDWHPQCQDYLARQVDRMAQLAWADDARAKRDPGSIVVLAFGNRPFSRNLRSYANLIDRSGGGVVEYSTVHSSKGSEWDHVILIDGIATHYPISHPAEPIQRDMVTAEERQAEGQRLLYVAVTRAKHSLAILAPTELHPKLSAAVEIARR